MKILTRKQQNFIKSQLNLIYFNSAASAIKSAKVEYRKERLQKILEQIVIIKNILNIK